MTKAKGKKTTAAELMADLARDPTFQAQHQLRDGEIRQRQALLAEAEAPVVRELKEAGIDVDSVWDFVNGVKPTPQSVLILLKHIANPPTAFPDRALEGIARGLITPLARVGWETLRERFVSDPDRSGMTSKAAIGFALAAAADDQVFDDLVVLVSDKRHGQNRIGLLGAFAVMNNSKGMAVLEELAHDPDLSKEVQRLVKRRKRK